MAKPFSQLRAKMSPQAQERSRAKAEAMLAAMPLDELRQARGLSQKHLAEVLGVQQPSIAKLEKRTDMYLSTLRSHVEAMGGDLVVLASFPEGTVRIKNFGDLDARANLANALWAEIKSRYRVRREGEPVEGLQDAVESAVDIVLSQLPAESKAKLRKAGPGAPAPSPSN